MFIDYGSSITKKGNENYPGHVMVLHSQVYNRKFIQAKFECCQYNIVKRKDIKQKIKERQSKQIKENSPCDLDIDPLNCTECRFG